MTRAEAFGLLQAAYDTLLSLHGDEVLEISSADTVFALGEALGVVSKAKALMGRDIDTFGPRRGTNK